MYNGIEVDMLTVGNADAILVTRWVDGTATRILIDGGDACDAEAVVAFLVRRGATHLNHVVCSHPHDDHAAGLVDVVKNRALRIDAGWMHLPWCHVDLRRLGVALERSQAAASKVVRIIRASVETARRLVDAFAARRITPQEPFDPGQIDFLTVAGPTKGYYEELLKEFTDYERLRSMEESLQAHEEDRRLEDILEHTSFGAKLLEGTVDELGAKPTEPENNSSTILGTKYGDNVLLFTADAGVPALMRAKNSYALQNLRWMQIPHHGSQRNISQELIAHFAPKTAFVSASGEKKHPRRKVVNAFKEAGARVYSTHYPTAQNMWFFIGSVPSRPDYTALTALYDAE
jgi:beta-lactamase superfamily II metal-dependent hydrolase